VGAAQAIGATGSGVVSVRLDPLCGTPADS
jgi:hypothetical protein